MNFFRRLFDRLFLTDEEWKIKNCPTLAGYLFCSEEERHRQFLEMAKGADARFEQGVKDGVCGYVYAGDNNADRQ